MMLNGTDARLLDLESRHRNALQSAVRYLVDRFDPSGIVVSGTLLRGEGHKNSDLDLAVLHDAPWRQRIQRIEHGVPVEIFVNPEYQWRKSFDGEVRTGKPAMLGILSTGAIVWQRDDRINTLVQLARHMYGAGPRLGDEYLTQLRYALACQYEDAEDMATDDPDRAEAFALNALLLVARYFFHKNDLWLPREKNLLSRLEEIDPSLGAAIRAVFRAPAANRVALTRPIVERISGDTHFFAWESSPQPVTP